MTSAGTASGAAAAAATPGGITYGVDGFNNLAAANAFYGLVSGNDNTGINGLDTSWGGGWTLAAKDNTDSGDDVANRVLGIAFSVNAGAKASAGQWTLNGSGLTSGSLLLDVVAVLKSSTQYGLYYFHDVIFDGAVGGDWLSPSFNGNGVRQDLSHLSIYVRPGSEQPVLSQPQGGLANTAGGSAAVPHAVPEPGTLALLSAALVAMTAIRRKALRRG
ncbi:PEP-CTERM sorting domain-containing protein [Azohydromonas lata]|uniref:PEP-CTERM sorting domain-containing protein n=1 Tax=Azohydromonas lata TaxID=45677 RepID=UPI001470A407|nr:PEP-CTERM sorting domain-containing protein [Azohydromonas lata]